MSPYVFIISRSCAYLTDSNFNVIVTFQTTTLTHRNRPHLEASPVQATHSIIGGALAGTQQPQVGATKETRMFKGELKCYK